MTTRSRGRHLGHRVKGDNARRDRAQGRPRHRVAQTICDNLEMNPCPQAIFGGSGKARMAALESFAPRRVAEAPAQGADQGRAGAAQESFGGAVSGLVERARAYSGRTGPSLGLPSRLWCSDLANLITGGGTGSRAAKSWLAKPRVSPQVDAIVVTSQRGGGQCQHCFRLNVCWRSRL